MGQLTFRMGTGEGLREEVRVEVAIRTPPSDAVEEDTQPGQLLDLLVDVRADREPFLRPLQELVAEQRRNLLVVHEPARGVHVRLQVECAYAEALVLQHPRSDGEGVYAGAGLLLLLRRGRGVE